MLEPTVSLLTSMLSWVGQWGGWIQPPKKHPQEGKWTLPERIVRDPKGGAGVFLPLWLLMFWQEPCLSTPAWGPGPQPPGGRRQATGSAPGPAGCMLGCENCCPGGFCWDQAPSRPQLEGPCRGQRGQPSYSHKPRISSFPPRPPSPLLLPLYYLTSPLARMLALWVHRPHGVAFPSAAPWAPRTVLKASWQLSRCVLKKWAWINATQYTHTFK